MDHVFTDIECLHSLHIRLSFTLSGTKKKPVFWDLFREKEKKKTQFPGTNGFWVMNMS